MMLLFSVLLVCWGTAAAQTFHYIAGNVNPTVIAEYSNPCDPSPCGPNTRCTVSRTGAAQCRCIHGYFPKPDTITGCGPQCTSDSECRRGTELCIGEKCVDVCEGMTCGINAFCEIDYRVRRGKCVCYSNYIGSPHVRCRSRYEETVASRARNLFAGRAISGDPCYPSPCGRNTDCRVRNNRPVCQCLPGHTGNPLTECRKGECQLNEECPSSRACVNNYCVDPCGLSSSGCGINAECNVRSHIAVCSCPPGFEGNPAVSCTVEYRDPCEGNPCGRNAKCTSSGNRAQCRCLDTYKGDPLAGCTRECESDHECASHLACINYECDDPCTGTCGENAICEIVNHRAICKCQKDFLGDPFVRCYPECVEHHECPTGLACFSFKCTDPCIGACGINAECKVVNHKAICSCPKDYVGHPFERCRPFERDELCVPNPCGLNAECTPGIDRTGNDRPVCTCPVGYIGDPLKQCTRGECTEHRDCPSYRSCYNYVCENPCDSRPCGSGAECEVKNHQPICKCPRGYTGDPLSHCRPIARSSRRYRYYN